MNIVNHIEISCFGLRRSGNHAIINWLIRQHDDKFVFLNDVKLYYNKDPYKSYSKATIGGINPLLYHKGALKPRRFIKYMIDPKVEYTYGRDRKELDTEKLRHSMKPLLIHSYEHYHLSNALEDFESKREQYLGNSQNRFDAVILRDPYNVFASLIKRKEKLSNPNPIIEKWIEHAKEYLGQTNRLRHRVSVNYNQWFLDEEYRKKLAESLGLPFTDAGISAVPNVGKGSSFDGGKYDGKAHEMPVLERYKDYREHPVMLEVFAHEELNEIAREIFGSM